MSYHVPVSAYPLIQDPPFLLFLFWLGAGIGYRCLLILRVPLGETTRLERGILSTSIGMGLLQYLSLTLGMTGTLTPRAHFAGLAVLTMVFGRDMVRLARSIAHALRQKRSAPPMWMVAGAVLLAIPLTIAFLKALLPPLDPDGIGYHLTAPKRWLQSGGMVYLPTFTHTNAPMGVEMLYSSPWRSGAIRRPG